MPEGSAGPVTAARPSIAIGGRVDATLTGALLGLEIVESASGLYRSELLFGNWGGSERAGFQYFDGRTLDFGKALDVRIGDDKLFSGRVSALDGRFPEGGPPQIGVRAEDRLQDLRMTRRTRSFADRSVADVVRSIAGDHGLTADVNVDGGTHALLAQVNQSDLAFLRELARHNDAEAWADENKLHFVTRARRNGGTLELRWAGKLRAFDVIADLATQRTRVVASGWDVRQKGVAKFEADEAAIRGELGSDKSGLASLESAFGGRVETLAHGVPANAAEARALAESAMRLFARRFVVGHGIAETSATLKVGAKLDIKGLGPRFEGRYVVHEVRHRYDAKAGLRTEFWCDRPGLGAPGA